jgi:hypothetical protein
MLTFSRDPGLRAGDKTPPCLYDLLGRRTLNKHWPAVKSYLYDYPVYSGSKHYLILSK